MNQDQHTWREDRLKTIRHYEEAERQEDFINDDLIWSILNNTLVPESTQVREVLAKARELNGLSLEDAAVLLNCRDQELVDELFSTAHLIKQEIYGNRIVLFAPLYISNPCVNNCAYCGFRENNNELERRSLSMDEIGEEIKIMTSKGQKRLIMVCGEHPDSDVDYMCRSIEKIYQTKNGRNEIRRVNVNAPPLSVDEYRQVKETGIGTYQVFQETYHHETYRRMHPVNTPKGSYRWRAFALHRAQEAGIDDVAIGALFGLYDWRFEVLGLISHAHSLEKEFGVGPHTISFPRLEPAINTPLSVSSRYLVSDDDFKKVIAVLRCAVPYTGLILTCRENPEMRRGAIKLGVSQTDAGSRIAVGGYAEMEREHIMNRQQFQLGDTRQLDSFILELCQNGYIPSFCTSCYRAERTGCNFMSYAKKGLVKNFCLPNAVLTFKEYLLDYASPETRLAGEKIIRSHIDWFRSKMPKRVHRLETLLAQMDEGERDFKF